MRVFVDLDGVVADFDGYYESCFGVRPDRNQADPDGLWENITGHGSFYRSLPKLPDADVLVDGIRQRGYEVVFLTGIPYSVPMATTDKQDWVMSNFGPNQTTICCRSRDKHRWGTRGDILIDDWEKYRSLWEGMGGVFILHRSAATSLAELDRHLAEVR